MPSDSLTLTVLISCQEKFVGLFQELLELGDLFLLVGINDVIRGETILDIDGEAPVGTLLHVGGQLRGLWQVANVTDRGGHMVIGSQVSFDRRRLSGRLHDHQLGRCHCLSLPLLPRICSTLCWSSDGERRGVPLGRTLPRYGAFREPMCFSARLLWIIFEAVATPTRAPAPPCPSAASRSSSNDTAAHRT